MIKESAQHFAAQMAIMHLEVESMPIDNLERFKYLYKKKLKMIKNEPETGRQAFNVSVSNHSILNSIVESRLQKGE